MDLKKEIKILGIIVSTIMVCWFMPIGIDWFDKAVLGALQLVKWYAREHVLFCLLPAFFIAGGISTFISKAAVIKYFGAKANKFIAYSVASLSGVILAVCSCTVLPLFAGIYKRGAGIGPATAFLYSGPAVNVMAIILTARILGYELGVARAVGAIVFSVVIGLCMQFIFRHDKGLETEADMPELSGAMPHPVYADIILFGLLVGLLVFANWAKPETPGGVWGAVFAVKWYLVAAAFIGTCLAGIKYFGLNKLVTISGMGLVMVLAVFFHNTPQVPFIAGIIIFSLASGRGSAEARDWLDWSWYYGKTILPLLFGGVLLAGFLLGPPGGQGVVPQHWISGAVGGNSLQSNFFASVAGAFMYFATLTEVPILQGLINNGMGKGPALALLLAGPALSLPNMLVIRKVMGTKKTVAYVSLVIILATFSGIIYGALF
ncbi:permease [Lentisphaerota bacterium ZTH]|nr:permease [Lentisphaerota bacterium]WET06687.1 permease [Lentisphaerota bacterium ZTH]